jgi:two-component system sensor histidine kinase UhpB
VTGKGPKAERPRSLTRRLFIANAALILVTFFTLALTPLTVKSPLQVGSGGAVSLIGLTAVLAVNLTIIRRSLEPLSRLTASMRRVDLLRPGTRVPVYGDSEEVLELTRAFNDMLARLEAERRESVRRTVTAQEDERLQLARELHDEIGQGLTALLLQLDYLGKAAPPEVADELVEAREAARSSLEEVRRIARQLRPEALDDLGLVSAINHLADRIAGRSQLAISRAVERDLPPLDRETELVIYRVAQESLTNVIRHADAEHVHLNLALSEDGGVVLRVADDGRGIDGASEGAGIKGMRERAVLAGARLDIGPARMGGTEVRLEVAGDAGTRGRAN